MRRMVLVVLLAAPAVQGQNLMERDPMAPPAREGLSAINAPLYGASLFAIRPPEPTTFKVHDLVTIIINENSKATSDQTLDTKKNASTSATLGTIVDPMQLLEARIIAGNTNQDLLDVSADRTFKGEGEMERNDRIIDRITAEVIDVKPNGVLVLEARRVLEVDSESKTLLVTGKCHTDDITKERTIQSNQLADLSVSLRHEGELRKTARKGLITRALDALFAF